MWKAQPRRRRVVLLRAVIGVAVLALAPLPASAMQAPSGASSALRALGESVTHVVPAPLELRRYRHHRLSAAGRRVRAIYARAARARARIPERVRVAHARRELAHMQALGPIHCLATAIYFEARKESAHGQRAVADVVLARSRTPGRPKSVCGVIYEGSWRTTGCQFSFACDNLADVPRLRADWIRARRIAAAAISHRGRAYARGALFYHATYVHPRWSRHMVRVARIGAHIFYRPRRGRLL